jgi:hypothetical protein
LFTNDNIIQTIEELQKDSAYVMVFMKSGAARSGVSPTNKSLGDRSPMDNTPRRFNIELGKSSKNKKNKK